MYIHENLTYIHIIITCYSNVIDGPACQGMSKFRN